MKDLIKGRFPELSGAQIDRIFGFYEAMKAENEVQNLTRLISPADFIDGHLQDAVELLKTGFLTYPAMDLGSGGGVPGLLCAAIDPNPWFLVDSEKRKADFLGRAAHSLGLDDVQAVPERAEAFLQEETVGCITARAVGTVEKILSWIAVCSTWNKLILLKGPGWKEEWENLQKSRFRRDLVIEATHEYSVGPENKQRVIVLLKRVPRGTKALR